MTKTYNPFNLDKPTIDLGEHGVYTLADVTESRQKKLQQLWNESQEWDRNSSEVDEKVLRAMCSLPEVASENSAGLAQKLYDDFKAEKLGWKGLTGLANFIGNWLNDEESVGED